MRLFSFFLLCIVATALYSAQKAKQIPISSHATAIWTAYDPVKKKKSIMGGCSKNGKFEPVELSSERLDKDIYVGSNDHLLQNSFTITRCGLPLCIWMGKDGEEDRYAIFSIQMMEGGVWTTPTRISALNENVVNIEQVIVGNLGQVTTVWNSAQGVYDTQVRAATLPACGYWSNPATLCH